MSSPSTLPELVSIGITTKDRWNDLADSLRRLRGLGFDRLETLVIDDGSTVPVPDAMRTEFPWVKFERYEPSRGYIEQRNHLISTLTRPFYLSFDDDSFPETGDMEAAARWLLEHENVAALRFPIVNMHDPLNNNPPGPPKPAQAFTGCGFLMRRDVALKLGGFEERLEFYSEEIEYSLRSFGAGYDIYEFPAIQVRHMSSPINRISSHRAYLAGRNYVLVCLWHYPLLIGILRAARFFPVQMTKNPRTRGSWFALLRGCIAGFGCALAWPAKTKRLTAQQFATWDGRG